MPEIPELPTRLLASRNERQLLWAAIALGFAYGILGRLVFGGHVAEYSPLASAFAPMTLGFLFLVPFALGFLGVWIGSRDTPWRWWLRIVTRWFILRGVQENILEVIQARCEAQARAALPATPAGTTSSR